MNNKFEEFDTPINNEKTQAPQKELGLGDYNQSQVTTSTETTDLFAVDLSDLNGEFEPLPDGDYLIEIVDFKLNVDNKNGDKKMTKIEVKIIGEGEFAGRHEWFYYVTSGSKYSANSKAVKEGKARIGEPNVTLDKYGIKNTKDFLQTFDVNSMAEISNVLGQIGILHIDNEQGPWDSKSIHRV